jgi:hypothetical protein
MITRAVDAVKRPDVHEQQPVGPRAEPYGPQRRRVGRARGDRRRAPTARAAIPIVSASLLSDEILGIGVSCAGSSAEKNRIA